MSSCMARAAAALAFFLDEPSSSARRCSMLLTHLNRFSRPAPTSLNV